MDPQVDRVLAEARARGIDIRTQIGSTGYCESWAVGDALVMRIPRSEFPAALGRGDGPIVADYFAPQDGYAFRGVDSAVLAHTLLESSTERQRGVDRGPLARFVDRLELAGVAVALHERPAGRAPVRDDLRAIARALVELHDVLGYHGHLAPAHVFVDGDRVTFTDPLPVYPKLLGAVGYAIPIAAAELAPRDEGLLLRDVAALVAIAAEACGCDLGWDHDFVAYLENGPNRSIGRPWDARPALAELARRTRTIEDTALRGWIDAAARLALDHYLPVPSVRPKTSGPRPATRGIARSLLAHFDFYAALGAIAARVTASPSLMDFVAMERGAVIEAYDSPDTAFAAFGACDASFATIAGAVPELQRLYARTFGEQPAGALAPIAHHPDVYADVYPLRTLLLDVDRLLAPTPATLGEASGLAARALQAIEQLRDAQQRQNAARRYVNYVSNRNRVY